MNEKMTAGDLCNRIVTVAERDMPVAEAARLMRSHHVGSLVVTDSTGAGRVVVGILTDRDIVTSVVAEGLDPEKLSVGAAMTSPVTTALESETVMDLLATMRRRGVRRVPITTAGQVLVGLMTLDDAIEIVAEQLRGVVQAMDAEQKRERRDRG
jgi:CBS domain-containing protein